MFAPSPGRLAMYSGVGCLPPSRSARSPVTQSSPSWLGARPSREGQPSQTPTACLARAAARGPCVLCLIAGLWLNPLQGEELPTTEIGMTIVFHIPGLLWLPGGVEGG